MDDRWLSVDESADYLGVAKDTINAWVTSKDMPGHKVEHFWKFKKEDVDAWVREGGAAASSDDFDDKAPRTMLKQRSARDNNDMSDLDQDAQAPESALEEAKVFDYISGNPVTDSDKEQVRQRIARTIIHEYGIAAEDWSLTPRSRCWARTSSSTSPSSSLTKQGDG